VLSATAAVTTEMFPAIKPPRILDSTRSRKLAAKNQPT
jgi:hypothetical protein